MISELDKNLMNIAEIYGLNSKCIRTKIGAIIEKNGVIISHGINGVSENIPPCEIGSIGLNEKMDAFIETGKPDNEYSCQRIQQKVKSTTGNDVCRGIHAEWDAILKCNPKDLNDATLYSTLEPCPTCIKTIIRVGIIRVVFKDIYSDIPNKIMQKLIEDSRIIYEQLEV